MPESEILYLFRTSQAPITHWGALTKFRSTDKIVTSGRTILIKSWAEANVSTGCAIKYSTCLTQRRSASLCPSTGSMAASCVAEDQRKTAVSLNGTQRGTSDLIITGHFLVSFWGNNAPCLVRRWKEEAHLSSLAAQACVAFWMLSVRLLENIINVKHTVRCQHNVDCGKVVTIFNVLQEQWGGGCQPSTPLLVLFSSFIFLLHRFG